MVVAGLDALSDPAKTFDTSGKSSSGGGVNVAVSSANSNAESFRGFHIYNRHE
jgi:hypothetical protein